MPILMVALLLSFYLVYKVKAKGLMMYGMDGKLKLGDQLKTSEQLKKL